MDEEEFSLGPAEEEISTTQTEEQGDSEKLLFEPATNKVRINIDRFYELMVEDWRNSKSLSYDIYLQQGNIPSGTLYKTMGIRPFQPLTDEDIARIQEWKAAWIKDADKFQRTDLAKREDIVEAVGCLAANFLNKKRNEIFNEVIKKATRSHLATIITDKCTGGIVHLDEMASILKAARDFGLLTDELQAETLASIKEQIASHNARIQTLTEAFRSYYESYTSQNQTNAIDNEKNRRALYEKFVELRILDNQISTPQTIIPEQTFKQEFPEFLANCNIQLKPAIELFEKQYFAEFARQHDMGRALSQEDYSILKAVAATTYGIDSQAWEDFERAHNIRHEQGISQDMINDIASRSTSAIEAKLSEIDDLKLEIERLKKQGQEDQRAAAEELMKREAQLYAQQKREQERQEAEQLAEAKRQEEERAAALQKAEEERLAELKQQEIRERWAQSENRRPEDDSAQKAKKNGVMGKLLLLIVSVLLWLVAILVLPPQPSVKVALIIAFSISILSVLLFKQKKQKFFTIILPILLLAFFKIGLPAMSNKLKTAKKAKQQGESNNPEGTYFSGETLLEWKQDGIDWGGSLNPVSLNKANKTGALTVNGSEKLNFRYYKSALIFDPPISMVFVKKNARFAAGDAAAVAGKTYEGRSPADKNNISLDKSGKINIAKDKCSYVADADARAVFYWGDDKHTGVLFYTDGGAVLRKQTADEKRPYDIYCDVDSSFSAENQSPLTGKSFGGKWSDKFTVTASFGTNSRAKLVFSDGDTGAGPYLVSKDGKTVIYNHREDGRWFAFTTDADASSVKFYKTLDSYYPWERK